MAKIITPGKTPRERALEIKIRCPNCQAVFQLEADDHFEVDGTAIICTCANPKCPRTIRVDLSSGGWTPRSFKRWREEFGNDPAWSWMECVTSAAFDEKKWKR